MCLYSDGATAAAPGNGFAVTTEGLNVNGTSLVLINQRYAHMQGPEFRGGAAVPTSPSPSTRIGSALPVPDRHLRASPRVSDLPPLSRSLRGSAAG